VVPLEALLTGKRGDVLQKSGNRVALRGTRLQLGKKGSKRKGRERTEKGEA